MTRAHEPANPGLRLPRWRLRSLPPLGAHLAELGTRLRLGLAILAARLSARLGPTGVARVFAPALGELHRYREHLAAVRRAQALAERGGPIKLDLGGGIEGKAGWVNIDLRARHGLRLDLRRALPFADESVTEIYSEHFLTCLSYPHELMPLLQECHRVLTPGGTITVGVPDAGRAFRAYARGTAAFYRDKYWSNVRPQFVRSPMDELNWLIYMGDTHRHMFDEPSLRMRLEEAGFAAVQARAPDPAIDDPARAHQTLYLQALKPVGTRPDPEAIRLRHTQALLDELAGDDALAPALAGLAAAERYALLRLAMLVCGSAGRTLFVGPAAPALLDLLERFGFPPAVERTASVRPYPPFPFPDGHFRIIAALGAAHDTRAELARLLESSRYARAHMVITEDTELKIPTGLVLAHRERLPAGAGTLFVLKRS